MNAIVVAVAAFVLIAGSIWYFAVMNGPEKVSVTEVHYEWGATTRDDTELLGRVRFQNSLDVPATLQGFEYTYEVNGLRVASNRSDVKAEIPAQGSIEQPIQLSFPTSFVLEWFQRHVEEGEKSQAILKGTAEVKVSDRNQTVRFESVSRWESRLSSSLSEFSNCGQDPREACLEKVEAEWAGSGATLRLRLSIHNPTPEALRVEGAKVELRLAGETLGEGDGGGLEVAPDGTEPTSIEIQVRGDRLLSWWPRHVQGCERSSAEARFQADASGAPVSTPPASTSSSPPPTTSSPAPPSSSSPSPTSSSPSPTPSSSEPPPSSTPPPNSSLPSGGRVPAAPDAVLQFSLQLADGQRVEWTIESESFVSRFACREND